MTNIIVVGPGAIGCLCAFYLSYYLKDTRIVLLDKSETRARILNYSGITVIKNGVYRLLKIPVYTSVQELGKVDIVIICTKSYDTISAIRNVWEAVDNNTLIISMQNGADNVDKICSKVPRSRVFASVTYNGATAINTGMVKHAGYGKTYIAPADPANYNMAQLLSEKLSVPEFQFLPKRDMNSLIWKKLIINASINPVAAIAGVKNGILIKDPSLWIPTLFCGFEAFNVTIKAGIRIGIKTPVYSIRKTCIATAENFCSMLQDIKAGKKTEIDSINGVILKKAEFLNIKTPFLYIFYKFIKAREKTLFWRKKIN